MFRLKSMKCVYYVELRGTYNNNNNKPNVRFGTVYVSWKIG